MTERPYERLGYFYLGRMVDVEARTPSSESYLYDSRDLTTHAVILGMTGSGKTGLGIALLEEAAIDGVPALILDPKGDLANLMLAFPELAPEQFLPFVREEEALRKGVSRQALAQEVASRWRQGLAEWDQDGERVRRFRDSSRPLLITPGSVLARPLAVFGSLSAPDPRDLADRETLRDRIEATVSSLLALLGMTADPLQSREHILLAQLLDSAWVEGRDLNLPELLRLVQRPPFTRVGALELETFFPERDRFALAMRLNHLLAAPGFEVWLQGEPLAFDSLLWDETGRPRLAIVSLAHLSDAERMFVVSLLATAAVTWVRGQAGSGTLRALLFFDEVFGYLPPSAQPPSKKPILTLLKQARASGLGLVLATQNPVDLDYKALSNVGTWMLGRLQTERDKLRVLDGLETVAIRDGPSRAELDRLLATLERRQFLIQNVHRPGPVLIESRWVMSYLAGPLDRRELQQLVGARSAAAEREPERVEPAYGARSSERGASQPPTLPPGIAQRFLSDRAAPRPLTYLPALWAEVRVDFERSRPEIRHRVEEVWIVPFSRDGALRPERSLALACETLVFRDEPESEGSFGPLPPAAARPESYGNWQRELEREVARRAELVLWEMRELGQSSRPGESEREFRIRLGAAVREARDQAVEVIRTRWQPRLERIQSRIDRAEARLVREREEATSKKIETALSAGSTLLSALFGRKKLSATTVTRTASTLRSASRSQLASREVDQAAAELARAEEERERLQAELEAELAETAARFDLDRIPISRVSVRPKRQGIEVRGLALCWIPAGGSLAAELEQKAAPAQEA